MASGFTLPHFHQEQWFFTPIPTAGQGGDGKGWMSQAIRRVKCGDYERAGLQVYTPSILFGEMYLHADPLHTNDPGNTLIAKAVLEELKRDERVQRYLTRLQARR